MPLIFADINARNRAGIYERDAKWSLIFRMTEPQSAAPEGGGGLEGENPCSTVVKAAGKTCF